MAELDQKMNIKDTAVDYEDMVKYKLDKKNNFLSDLLTDKKDDKPKIGLAKKDVGFEEDWQILKVNFNNEQEYRQFMKKLGYIGVSSTREIIYERPETRVNILNF